MSDLVGNHIVGFPTRRLKYMYADYCSTEQQLLFLTFQSQVSAGCCSNIIGCCSNIIGCCSNIIVAQILSDVAQILSDVAQILSDVAQILSDVAQILSNNHQIYHTVFYSQ